MVSVAFRCWQGVIVGIRAVPIASFAYLVGLSTTMYLKGEKGYKAITTAFRANSLRGKTALGLLTAWATIECAFVPFYYSKRKQLQRKNEQLKHRCTTPAERKDMVKLCVQTMREHDSFAPRYGGGGDTRGPSARLRDIMEGWFLGTKLEDITYEDFRKWLAWAFFEVVPQDLSPADSDELDQLLEWFQQDIGYTFPKQSRLMVYDKRGRGPKSIRLSADRIYDTFRPLLYYGAIKTMHTAGMACIYAMGFRQVTPPNDRPGAVLPGIYMRPARKVKTTCHNGLNRDPMEAAREANTKQALPVVFIHGIGIGPTQYLKLIANLPTEVPVYLVTWPHVSMQIQEQVPTIDDNVATIAQTLRRDGIEKACFVGHSLGTTAVAWMLHDQDAASLVGSCVLMDPVTFLLIDPAIASNFIHRTPRTCIELLMHYFVSRELFIAHTLSRHFSWSHNVLFYEDLPGAPARLQRSGRLSRVSLVQQAVEDADASADPAACAHTPIATSTSKSKGVSASGAATDDCERGICTTVILSEDDMIVPAQTTRRYLERQFDKHGEEKQFVDLVWFQNANHGELMAHDQLMHACVDKIRERCGLFPSQ